jgi:hypothetical protein
MVKNAANYNTTVEQRLLLVEMMGSLLKILISAGNAPLRDFLHSL